MEKEGLEGRRGPPWRKPGIGPGHRGRPRVLRPFLPLLSGALGLVFAFPDSAMGQFRLLGSGDRSLELGGYLQSLTGIHDAGYEVEEKESVSGFNAEVLRLKWMIRLGEGALLEIHDRIQTQVTTAPSAYGGSVAGFGVSVVPGRSLDLSSDILKKDRVRAWHDVDRLSLTLYTGVGDVTVGRQAITWGVSNLFPVLDLWAQYSPFELDTEEKPGVDAVRVLSYPRSGVELDMVVADKGSAEDLSAGIRATLGLSWADIHLAGGKFWNQLLGSVGISAPHGIWIFRAEGVLPYDLDEEDTKLPRATLGVDLIGGEILLSGEYHFNGIGVREAEEYEKALEEEHLARGESYYLGRQYLGLVGSWTPGNDRLSLTASGMVNLQDGSAILTPILTYDFGQETRLSVGGMVSSGSAPLLGDDPELRSEYGMYGDMLFTRVAIYF